MPKNEQKYYYQNRLLETLIFIHQSIKTIHMEKVIFRYKRLNVAFIKYTILIGLSYEKEHGIHLAIGPFIISYELQDPNKIQTF